MKKYVVRLGDASLEFFPSVTDSPDLIELYHVMLAAAVKAGAEVMVRTEQEEPWTPPKTEEKKP